MCELTSTEEKKRYKQTRTFKEHERSMVMYTHIKPTLNIQHQYGPMKNIMIMVSTDKKRKVTEHE
jgi:hypothetical protein